MRIAPAAHLNRPRMAFRKLLAANGVDIRRSNRIDTIVFFVVGLIGSSPAVRRHEKLSRCTFVTGDRSQALEPVTGNEPIKGARGRHGAALWRGLRGRSGSGCKFTVP